MDRSIIVCFETRLSKVFSFIHLKVIIDDRLPVANGQIAFTQTDKSHQFWASLLEKAYAK